MDFPTHSHVRLPKLVDAFGAAARHRAGSTAAARWKARARRMPMLGWAALALSVILLGWLLARAAPWELRASEPIAGLTFVASDGSLIARKGSPAPVPVDVGHLPPHVANAFIAIEDRRFYRHPGFDVRGLLRAALRNLMAGGVAQGGSTITQQYVKLAFLTHDRTLGRKARELLLAAWLEIWVSKREILNRYLSTAYFGEGAYGLAAASARYFDKPPVKLTTAEAAMLAGLVKAPSKLAPTKDRGAAVARMRTVLAAMVDAGYLSGEQARASASPRLRDGRQRLPTGSYFVDWLADDLAVPDAAGVVRTTLDAALQRRAVKAVARVGSGQSQVALVAIRPDGRVVAMIGGRSYKRSPFNRATQPLRQPGSTFKLFVYLAALRQGATPDSLVEDRPLVIGNWRPENSDGRYRGLIPLREAFAQSSNVAAVRVSEATGRDRVVQAARDLGVTSPLPDGPSLALGTGSMTLLELTAAYAALAAGEFPVRPHGIPIARQSGRKLDPERERAPMLDMLWEAANTGTGRLAALSQPTFGKTGTSQGGRDALFVGMAGDLIAGVWIGRDDNNPVEGSSGGRLPALIWRDFMGGAPLQPMRGGAGVSRASTESRDEGQAALPVLAAAATARRGNDRAEAKNDRRGKVGRAGKGKKGKGKGRGKGKG